MYTLRCTQLLLARLSAPTPIGIDAPPPTTILGDWYANRLNVGRRQLIICTSERSLLTVVVPAKNLPQLPERLRHAVTRLLQRLDIPLPQIVREEREMRWHQIGRTASRRVLGSLNEFVLLASHYVDDAADDEDLDNVGLRLSRTPCRPIPYQFPDQYTQALFRQAYQRPLSPETMSPD